MEGSANISKGSKVDHVPDESTAVKVGQAAAIAQYGEKAISHRDGFSRSIIW